MKKQTKNMLWVFFIIFIMFGSSFAFILMSVVPEQSQTQTNLPTNYVIDGYLDETFKQAYIQRGLTILEFHYYEGCCPDLIVYTESLPGELENQIIVEKILDNPIGSNPRISLESIRGIEERNVSSMDDIFSPLCNILVKPPIDCALLNMTDYR